MGDKIYRITGSTTLVEQASTISTMYVMQSPQIGDDAGYFWMYYQTSPSVFAVASFGSGTFTERLSGLLSYPAMPRDHTKYAYIRYENLTGWNIARASGGALSSVLTNLPAKPEFAPKTAGTYIAYTNGSGYFARTAENGTLSTPVLFANLSIAVGNDGAFLVHFTPQSGEPDNMYAYCQYGDGALSNPMICVDAKIESFYQQKWPEDYNGLFAGALKNSATEDIYIYRHIKQPVPANCCTAQTGGGCSSPGIMACVCAGDTTCCTTEWTTDCVNLIASRGCGECAM